MLGKCPKCNQQVEFIVTAPLAPVDNAVRPKYYRMGKFEVIDVIEDWKLDFSLGNAIKYISRAPHKGKQVEDLLKAIEYLKMKVERLEKEMK